MGDNVWQLIELLLQLFLYLGIGFVIAKIKAVGESGVNTVLSDLVINILLPCSILVSFRLDPTSDLINMILLVIAASVFNQALCVVINLFAFKWFTKEQQPSAKYAIVCPNAGFMGLPICEGIYGLMGLMLGAVHQIPQRIVMWTVGIGYYSKPDKSIKGMLKAFAHPCIVAVIIGFLMMVFGITLPAPINTVITKIGACCTPLSMMLIGMILSDGSIANMITNKTLYFTLLRLVVTPLIMYTATLPIHMDATARGVIVLMTALPAGAVSAILSVKYKMDAEFASNCLVVSTLFSCITLPLWVFVLGL